MRTAHSRSLRVSVIAALLLQTVSAHAATLGTPYALPAAKAGTQYEFTIRSEGGLAPFKWRVVEGVLPPGLELEPSGLLRGIPRSAKAQPYEFTLEVSDSSEPPQVCAQRFALSIAPEQLRIVINSENKLAILPPSSTSGRSAPSSKPAATTPAAEIPASPLASAIISGTLKAGADKVKGFVTLQAQKVFVEVFSGTGSGRESLLSRVPLGLIDVNTGEFTAKLTQPLKKDQRVRIVGALVSNGQETQLISDEVTVAAADPEKKPLTPWIKKPLLEGARSVSGIATTESEDTKPTKVRIEVYNGKRELAQLAETEDLKKTGEFTVNLDEPLAAGQIVKPTAFAGTTSSDEPDPDHLAFVEAVGDWGRARATFAFGAVFSKEREDFSKTDPYLNFNLDWNWYRRRSDEQNFTYLLNTFFETRLTAIPVDPDKQKQEGEQSQTPSAEKTCDPSTPDGFLCSRKAVMVQAGVYLPLYWNNWTTWRYGGDRNAFIIAPLVKGGLNTLTAEGEKGRNLLTFYSGGLRFGHLDTGKFTNPPSLPRDVAPRLVSYLDVTVGKWQNIEFKGRRQLRTAFEGRVKIPALPLRFGFDANIGRGPDDLRFLVDMNFDIGKMFKKFMQPN